MQKNLAKMKETGSVADRKRCGRPKKTTKNDDNYIVLTSRRNKRATANDLRAHLECATGVTVSKSTIKRRLHAAGLRGCVAVKKPLLSKRHKSARKKWAKERKTWTEDDWSRVVFSDESTFEVFSHSRQLYVRRKPNERYLPECLAPTVKFGGGKVMVWGCMAASGVVVVDGTVTSAKYTRLLSPCLKRDGEKLVGQNFVFQQDNAPVHTAKATKRWFASRNIDVMPWPAQSPDLNPIENLWMTMKRRVAEKCPQSIADLIKIIKATWNAIDPQTTRHLVNSMPRRLKAVLDSKGGATRY